MTAENDNPENSQDKLVDAPPQSKLKVGDAGDDSEEEPPMPV